MFKLPAKDPVEIIPISFSFGSELATGDAVLSCVVSVITFEGSDPNPSALLYLIPNLVQAPTVIQNIQGGLSGCQYHIKAVATLQSGGVLVRQAVLPVQSVV
jgi:hypothetical protein